MTKLGTFSTRVGLCDLEEMWQTYQSIGLDEYVKD